MIDYHIGTGVLFFVCQMGTNLNMGHQTRNGFEKKTDHQMRTILRKCYQTRSGLQSTTKRELVLEKATRWYLVLKKLIV